MNNIVALPENVRVQLRDWLIGREEDIAWDMEDIGDLREVFEFIVGREPKKWVP